MNQLLERGKQFFANREIVSRLPDKTLHRTTFEALHRRARQLAAALVRAGTKPGEPVATLMWNHAWHMEAYFGIPAAGAVLHTLNLRLNPEDLAYIIADAGDRILLVDDVLLPLVEKLKPLVRLEHIVLAPTGGSTVPNGYLITRPSSTSMQPLINIRNWTRTPLAVCVIPPGRQDGPRASSIPTAPRCCIRWQFLCRIASIFPAMMPCSR
ncbi:MAG: AMP-binding protein [Rhodocyclaceae bacterium]|nr:AMP-binding protein [Rhodocyclaceae bacterium]